MSETLQAQRALLTDIQRAHVHFVGIGGIGLSAIARILLAWGAQVSGSDLHLSPITASLSELGAVVFAGHRAENIAGATLVVISSAVPADNPEVLAAHAHGVPVVKRADILGEMMAGRYGIAIAGTHGKTTTTAMIAHILQQAGQDPTFIAGGIVGDLHANARAGRGPHFVIEADEYDHMFLGLRPQLAVVTHLEHDHPDCFPTMADMMDAFRRFLALVPADGHIVGCGDEPHVRELLDGYAASGSATAVRYGLLPGADWRAAEIAPNGAGGSDAMVLCHSAPVGHIRLLVPGRHNVKNALAAVAAATIVGIEAATACAALGTFHGVQRRFEIKGERQGITVVDDYAHHPTEIRATLAAVRERYPGRRLWAFFQPHTFSRLEALWADFLTAFDAADHVIVSEIYAARERAGERTVRAADLAEQIVHPSVRYCATLREAAQYLREHLQRGDVLVTLGAGDGSAVGEDVLQSL